MVNTVCARNNEHKTAVGFEKLWFLRTCLLELEMTDEGAHWWITTADAKPLAVES